MREGGHCHQVSRSVAAVWGKVVVVVVMFLLLLVTGGEELGGLIDAGSVLVQEPTVGMARCCLYGGGEGLVGECVGPADHLCVCVCV